MSRTLTPLELSALALLTERPMHPYEMIQLLRQRGQDELVKVRTASLYHAVERLLKARLVADLGVDREGKRPERTVYRITSAGRSAVEVQVVSWLREPPREFPVLPLAVGEAHFLSREQIADALAERRTAVQDERDRHERHRRAAVAKGVPRRMLLGKEFVAQCLDAELAWIDSVVADLHSGELDWDQPYLHPTPNVSEKGQL
ncbi:PadR family transcriptional regulator [Demequina sp.]|uniref:PadR family transcriptional regulator n=1 Tax=Demequina sp. TaxID=2050685 RepID=UPI003A87D5B3